jgi:Holliday junction resolvase RusA-like endonuclease
MLIALTCPGQPVSGKNHKNAYVVTTKTGKQRAVVATGKAVTRWRDRVVGELARQFAAYGVPQLKGRTEIDLVEHLAHPIGHPSNPDGDNVQAAIWDALQLAHIIADDRNVVRWSGERRHVAPGESPRVEITVRVLDP